MASSRTLRVHAHNVHVRVPKPFHNTSCTRTAICHTQSSISNRCGHAHRPDVYCLMILCIIISMCIIRSIIIEVTSPLKYHNIIIIIIFLPPQLVVLSTCASRMAGGLCQRRCTIPCSVTLWAGLGREYFLVIVFGFFLPGNAGSFQVFWKLQLEALQLGSCELPQILCHRYSSRRVASSCEYEYLPPQDI